jgi:hypothetical protein
MLIEIMHELSRSFEPNLPKNSGAQVWQLEYFPLHFVILVTNICPYAKVMLQTLTGEQKLPSVL